MSLVSASLMMKKGEKKKKTDAEANCASLAMEKRSLRSREKVFSNDGDAKVEVQKAVSDAAVDTSTPVKHATESIVVADASAPAGQVVGADVPLATDTPAEAQGQSDLAAVQMAAGAEVKQPIELTAAEGAAGPPVQEAAVVAAAVQEEVVKAKAQPDMETATGEVAAAPEAKPDAKKKVEKAAKKAAKEKAAAEKATAEKAAAEKAAKERVRR